MRSLVLSCLCWRRAPKISLNNAPLVQEQRLGPGVLRGLSGALQTRTAFRSKMSQGNVLDAVDDVDIDASGKFKYVLIKVWPKDNKDNSKFIVRGYAWAGYHADVFDEVEQKLSRQSFGCDCYGGGRIEHTPAKKTILVYGYSQGFGRADHSVSVAKLKARYPDYTSITFTNEGY